MTNAQLLGSGALGDDPEQDVNPSIPRAADKTSEPCRLCPLCACGFRCCQGGERRG